MRVFYWLPRELGGIYMRSKGTPSRICLIYMYWLQNC